MEAKAAYQCLIDHYFAAGSIGSPAGNQAYIEGLEIVFICELGRYLKVFFDGLVIIEPFPIVLLPAGRCVVTKAGVFVSGRITSSRPMGAEARWLTISPFARFIIDVVIR
jgi:hypothetical protein